MRASSRPPERSTRFEFATAGGILFGEGCVSAVPGLCRELGSRAAVVSGAPAATTSALVVSLEAAGMSVSVTEVTGEPSFEAAAGAGAELGAGSIDVVVGIGGGSAIDLAKAAAALATNPGGPEAYAEIAGRGLPLVERPLPVVAVPTTSGTGAEVTRNAVLTSPGGAKVSLRSPLMLPARAVVDPGLTLGLPRSLTASTGLDALTQLVEAFVSRRASPLTDGFCRTGVSAAASSLLRAYEDGGDIDARTGMSMASLLSGLALANAGLGAVHGIAAAVGGRFGVPHGEACSALLSPVTKCNIALLERLDPSSPALARYAEVATLVTGRIDASPSDLPGWIDRTVSALGIRGLGACGVSVSDLPGILDAGMLASSSRGNPVPLSPEFLPFLERAL